MALLAVLAGCASIRESAWCTVDVGPFSFTLPTDLAPSGEELRGIHSCARMWKRPGMVFGVDYGYPDDQTSWENAVNETVGIDSNAATIMTGEYGLGFAFQTMLRVPDFKPGVGLAMLVLGNTQEDLAIARRIFLSIRWKPG